MPLSPDYQAIYAKVDELFQQGFESLNANKNSGAFKIFESALKLLETAPSNVQRTSEYLADRFVCHYYRAKALSGMFVTPCKIQKAIVEDLNYFIRSSNIGDTCFTAQIYCLLGDANAAWKMWGEAAHSYSIAINKLKTGPVQDQNTAQTLAEYSEKLDAACKAQQDALTWLTSTTPAPTNCGDKREADTTIAPATKRMA